MSFDRDPNEQMVKAEPIYAFRRKGQDYFCTCTKERYDELCDSPHMFEMRLLYAHPPVPDGKVLDKRLHSTPVYFHRQDQLQAFREECEKLALAEARERIKVLEDAILRYLDSANQDKITTEFLVRHFRKALSTTSNTEAIDRVVRDAVEKERDRDEETIKMPIHWMSNIWSASQTLKSSDSILDRRDGEALEVMYSELAEAIRRIEP